MIEVGGLCRCFILFEVTSINYVLFSLSLGMLVVAQAVVSPFHDYMD